MKDAIEIIIFLDEMMNKYSTLSITARIKIRLPNGRKKQQVLKPQPDTEK